VLTPLTRNATGPLKLLIALTGFPAQTLLDGADTAIWAATSPELDGVTGKAGLGGTRSGADSASRREIHELGAIVEQQLAQASFFGVGTASGAATSEPPTHTVR
jgi:hypothetical protein